MTAIYKKELKSYFINMSGYVFMAFLLLFAGIYVTAVNLKSAYASFEYALSSMTVVFLFIIPILTMRSLAEERHSRTDQLLYSLPLKVSDIVIGKYLAMLTVLLIPTAIMSVYPIILSVFGTVHYAACYGAILAFFLLGAALIAICMFMVSADREPDYCCSAFLRCAAGRLFDERPCGADSVDGDCVFPVPACCIGHFRSDCLGTDEKFVDCHPCCGNLCCAAVGGLFRQPGDV